MTDCSSKTTLIQDAIETLNTLIEQNKKPKDYFAHINLPYTIESSFAEPQFCLASYTTYPNSVQKLVDQRKAAFFVFAASSLVAITDFTKLYFWSFGVPTKVLCFEDLREEVVKVVATTPKKGLFAEEVKQLFFAVTTQSVFCYALFEKRRMKKIEIHASLGCGVVDAAALPNGKLFVLSRETGVWEFLYRTAFSPFALFARRSTRFSCSFRKVESLWTKAVNFALKPFSSLVGGRECLAVVASRCNNVFFVLAKSRSSAETVLLRFETTDTPALTAEVNLSDLAQFDRAFLASPHFSSKVEVVVVTDCLDQLFFGYNGELLNFVRRNELAGFLPQLTDFRHTVLIRDDLLFLHDDRVSVLSRETSDEEVEKHAFAKTLLFFESHAVRSFAVEVADSNSCFLMTTEGLAKLERGSRTDRLNRKLAHALRSGAPVDREVTADELAEAVFLQLGQQEPKLPDSFLFGFDDKFVLVVASKTLAWVLGPVFTRRVTDFAEKTWSETLRHTLKTLEVFVLFFRHRLGFDAALSSLKRTILHVAVLAKELSSVMLFLAFRANLRLGRTLLTADENEYFADVLFRHLLASQKSRGLLKKLFLSLLWENEKTGGLFGSEYGRANRGALQKWAEKVLESCPTIFASEDLANNSLLGRLGRVVQTNSEEDLRKLLDEYFGEKSLEVRKPPSGSNKRTKSMTTGNGAGRTVEEVLEVLKCLLAFEKPGEALLLAMRFFELFAAAHSLSAKQLAAFKSVFVQVLAALDRAGVPGQRLGVLAGPRFALSLVLLVDSLLEFRFDALLDCLLERPAFAAFVCEHLAANAYSGCLNVSVYTWTGLYVDLAQSGLEVFVLAQENRETLANVLTKTGNQTRAARVLLAAALAPNPLFGAELVFAETVFAATKKTVALESFLDAAKRVRLLDKAVLVLSVAMEETKLRRKLAEAKQVLAIQLAVLNKLENAALLRNKAVLLDAGTGLAGRAQTLAKELRLTVCDLARLFEIANSFALFDEMLWVLGVWRDLDSSLGKKLLLSIIEEEKVLRVRTWRDAVDRRLARLAEGFADNKNKTLAKKLAKECVDN